MEALSVVASVIAIVGAISSSYETIDKIKGLPKAFDKVNKNLPLLQKILKDIQERLKATQRLSNNDENKQLVLQTIQQCEETAIVLREIFDKLEKKCKEDRDADKTWTKARAWYREALRGMKAHRVETLMKDIMDRIKTLAMNELLSLHADIDDIKSALTELSTTEPSLEDSEFESGANHATQVNESGAHGQQNNIQGGSHVINSGTNVSGNNHTFHFETRCYFTSSALEPRQLPASIQTGPRQITSSNHRWETIETIDSTSSLRRKPFRSSVWKFFKRASSLRTTRIEGLETGHEQRIPASHYIPFPKNNSFVGRVDALNKLQSMLETEERVALVGMGGIGKTEIALKIAYWVKDNRPLSVFWTSALSGDTFRRSCEEIVEKLSLRVEGAADPKLILQRYLSSDQAGSWLLVIDNLDEKNVLELLFQYLPQSDTGRILFTTRSAEVGTTVAGRNRHVLREMGEMDAADLFTRLLPHIQHIESQKEVQCLLEELDYLPLAINHAAAYIERNKTTVAKYLDIMKSSETELVNLMSREFAKSNDSELSSTSIAATWIVSFEQIAKDDPPAARILEFISQIEPKAIPHSILPDDEGQEQMSHAVGALLGYAFITEREEQDVYDMHSLVHLAARLWIERKGRLQSCVANSLSHLSRLFPIGDDFSERHWREFAPHLLRLIRATEYVQLQKPQTRWLGLSITYYLRNDGQDSEAANLIQHILEGGCYTFEEDDLLNRSIAILATNCYLDTHRPSKAIELLNKVLEERNTPASAADAHWLLMHLYLALAYRAAGQEHESLALADQLCQEMPAIEDVESADIAILQCEFANLYTDCGRVATGVDMLKSLSTVWDDSGKKNYAVVIKAQYCLAKVFGAKDCEKDAIDILENLREMVTKAGTEANYEFLASQTYLASMLLVHSQSGRAIEVCEATLDTYKRIGVGANLLLYFKTQRIMAAAYSKQGEFLKASNLLEKILAADARLYNDQDRAHLWIELNLGIFYCRQGRKDEGMRVLRSVADLRKRVLGENHKLTREALDIISKFQTS